jgi:hypothetical protein
MSETDFVRAEQLALQGRAWRRIVLLVGLVVAVPATLGSLSSWLRGASPPVILLDCVVLGWLAAARMVYELSGWAARRRWRKRAAAPEPIVSTWTREGLQMRVADAVSSYRWSDVRDWREDRHSLVIWTRDRRHLMFPKAQLPPEALAELRSYLCRDVSSPAAAEREPAIRPPAHRGYWVSISEDDFVAALGPRWSTHAARRLYQTLVAEGQPMDLGWSADGVVMAGPRRWERVDWTAFSGWHESAEALFVTTKAKGWMILPKRQLSDAALTDLKARLGGEATRRRRPRGV